jgi:hypothetical protein
MVSSLKKVQGKTIKPLNLGISMVNFSFFPHLITCAFGTKIYSPNEVEKDAT